MKKLQLLLTALLSIVSAVAMADEVTVSNIEADAGGNAEIVVNLSTAATNITGYQMSLYLPEGVTLQTDADDDYVYTLSGRHHSSHSLSINNQADGGLMLICYSMNKKSIASGDGELLRLPVNISPEAAGTALEVELRSIKLSDTSSNVATLPNVSFSITVQYALEAYAVVSTSGTTLTFYYDRLKHTRTGTSYELNNSYTYPGWFTYHRKDITTVVFDASFAEARPTSTYMWFAVFTNETSALTSIEGIEYLNTNEVTNMYMMFSGCRNLTSLDLGSFDTSSVTTMKEMFRDCSGLTSLDLSSFDTSSVTDMQGMFWDCSGLTTLDLRSFDTNNVTTMYSMFYGCSSLTSLDLSSFDTSSVTSMQAMFYNCSGLTSLDLSSFDTSSVTNRGYMFYGCSNLTTIYCGDGWNTDKDTGSALMFYYCTNLVGGAGTVYSTNHTDQNYAHVDGGPDNPGYLTLKGSSQGGETPGEPEAYVVYNDGTLTYYYDRLKHTRTGTIYTVSNFRTGETDGWAAHRTTITNVVFDESFGSYGSLTSTAYWFHGFSSLTTITGIQYLKTVNVTNMSYMFHGCSSLTSLDLTHFSTANVTNMSYMFYNCTTLVTINVSNTWIVTKVSVSNYMFYGCVALLGNDTAYDESSTDISKAFAGTGGYLTLKDDSQGGDEPSTIEVTDISQIDNVIYAEEMEERNGQQVTLSLMMKNTAAIRGFQFDLYLPEGATVVKSAKGRIQGALSAGRLPEEDEHDLTFSEQQDGAIRFLCSSQYNETFTGTEGEIATLQIRLADDMADGEYAIVLKNVKLTETDINHFYLTEEVVSKLTIVSYVTGDISGDGIVDVSDYTGVANYIHGNVPAGFYAKAADVDESGNIDVSDYTGIANIIHTGSVYGYSNTNYASRRSGEENLPDTDVSAIDNVIYVSPFTVTAGTQTMLSIKMKNTAAIRGFQFDLYLPEGMTVVKSDKGRIQGALSAGRLPEEDEHDLTFSEQQDGAIRFLCSSQYDETFTGTDGEIATLQVNVADGMADGDYALLLREVKLTETDISKFYLTELVKTTVTVGSSAGVDVVLDENSTEVPEATAGDVTILVKRTIKANEWNTICLPFDMTEAQTKAAFGNGAQLKEFTDYEVEYDTDDNVVGITVNFDDTDLSGGFYGNYPYLIKVENDIDEFTVTSTIDPVESDCYTEYDNGRTGKNHKVYGTFRGTYHAQTTVPNNCLFLSGNKFWYSTGQTKMKAFRAYFDFVDVLDNLENANARISMSFDETTGIIATDYTGYTDKAGAWYDLSGCRISVPSVSSEASVLPKGVYIRNGRKVVIK